MTTPPNYPTGDLRRMLSVLAAIDVLGDDATVVRISARSGVDRKTVTASIAAARLQAGVEIEIRIDAGVKNGTAYRIASWGPVLKKKGAFMALQSALNAHIIDGADND
jgi:hypothetical protein